KQQIVLANKMDLLWDPAKYEEFKNYVEAQGNLVFPISVILNDGIREILFKAYDKIQNIEREVLEDEADIKQVLREIKGEDKDYVITEIEEGVFEIKGRIVDDVLNKYVITMEEESIIEFLHMMRNLGLEEAMRDAGIQDGDTVKIADVEFDYVD
ncbi:MAG: Obg family GTPase CgtA, partial [Fusobacteriaceae bacterium]